MELGGKTSKTGLREPGGKTSKTWPECAQLLKIAKQGRGSRAANKAKLA